MRTRNTYVALLLAAGVGTALTVVSCAPDSTAPRRATLPVRAAEEKVLDAREKAGWIAKYHSDGLAYVYAQLAKTDGKPRTRAESCRLAIKAIGEFHGAARGSALPTALLGPSFNSDACLAASEVAPLRRSVFAGLPATARQNDLSPAATDYIERIGAVADNSTSDYDFLSQVDAIEAEAIAVLPASEAEAVSAVAAVARSSLSYWNENLESWMTLPGALPMPYSVGIGDASAASASAVSASAVSAFAVSGSTGTKSWWTNPAVAGFRKILSADILSGARTAYLAWAAGPIAVEAVAASALFGSATTTIALLLF
ncbi:MAG TPA: hypothetical protein VHM24_04165 [Gemmatimonadaceae bacterium]|nr:hypothetical protein [Gemmatimonadaceae bacterium]